jgi:hypothetical protein
VVEIPGVPQAERSPAAELVWLEARVVVQESVSVGLATKASAVQSGGRASARVTVVPVFENRVTIETRAQTSGDTSGNTSEARLELAEIAPSGIFVQPLAPLVARAGMTIRYAIDGHLFILLDEQGQKHRFRLVAGA